jgi:hypothetical protein
MNPKFRNAIAEIVGVLAMANAALPQLAATTHVPAWVGVVVALLINVGNQFLKDSTPPPTPAPTSVSVTSVPAAPFVSSVPPVITK